MKKIHIYIILSMLIAGLFSCADNEDFSSVHEMTADEIAEIARQDSILQAQKEKINADLVLEYSVEITTSKSLYDGAPATVEIDKIAELFGISEEEVLAGINGESGAPEIKGFAIEGTTHADAGSITNTNAPWGHWWDANGDLSEWGENAMVFAEFDTETSVFNVGQYPGHLTDGQTIKIIECLKYNEQRVAVVITINVAAPGQLSATVVSTQDLAINIIPKSSYDPDSLQFNLTQALIDLGVSSMDEVGFVGVNEDGSYNQEIVTGNGFWYDMNGFVGEYGDNASVYSDYGDFSADKISLGQYPGHLTAGQTFVIKYGLLANSKIVMLNVTVNVIAYEDPETAPAGDPEDVVMDVELGKAYSDDYASIQYDVKEILRNAFKKTTYQIYQAIISGDLKLYEGSVGDTDPVYTSDVPGYWIKADGTTGEWAEGLIYLSIGHNETELYLYGGNHPDNAVSGDTVSTKLIAAYNGVTVTLNITYNVE
ncbi:DUF4859 domain-containing protein [Labilibaculum manganireducens]|uniref:DUF4859 domain-containing protein n=1 Tax=Labilibaculum manganireducens TaxID=1940525 RepID=A0A2N3IAF9_9BACT|nr:DUF4859 domain-containing protein [Labilibaculum manganireducens]PKQ67275.1 DUF4859 domain-containing protein [Labilibaculum manganireducens]